MDEELGNPTLAGGQWIVSTWMETLMDTQLRAQGSCSQPN
jgi:hypothetical protein